MPASDQQILDAVPLMVFATDLSGNVLAQNHPAAIQNKRSTIGRPLHDALDAVEQLEQVEQCIRAYSALADLAIPLVRWEFAAGADERVMLVQVTRCLADGVHIGFVATLSEAQKEYAASDVLYLHKLKDALQACLIREDRLELAMRCFAFLPTRSQLDLMGWEEPNDLFHH